MEVKHVFLLGLLLPIVFAALKEQACAELDKQCHNNSECCGGCCKDNKCSVYEHCVSSNDQCTTFACPPGKKCFLQQVECLQSPCQPIPACRTPDNDYDYSV